MLRSQLWRSRRRRAPSDRAGGRRASGLKAAQLQFLKEPMAEATDRLARVMVRPDMLPGLSLREWDRLIPPARQSGLLARLTLAVERSVGLAAIAAPVRDHLFSAIILAEKH